MLGNPLSELIRHGTVEKRRPKFPFADFLTLLNLAPKRFFVIEREGSFKAIDGRVEPGGISNVQMACSALPLYATFQCIQ